MVSTVKRGFVAITGVLLAICACLLFLLPAYALETNDAFTAGQLSAQDEGEQPGPNEEYYVITQEDASTGKLEFTVTVPAGNDGSYGSVWLTNAKEYTGESLELGDVTYSAGGNSYSYHVVGVAFQAAQNNTHIKHVSFSNDLTGARSLSNNVGTYENAIGQYSFAGCTELETVDMPSKTNSIGSYAFMNCKALREFSFPTKAELYMRLTFSTTRIDCAIGACAFKGCTSLELFEIPAITTATRMGDAYYSFAQYNADVSPESGTYNRYRYCSGNAAWWHSGAGPVDVCGAAGSAFEGCTALKTVVFKAGAHLGAYAYFWLGSGYFKNCNALKSFIFESEQAYAVNPNGARHNGSYYDFFADSATPNLYYAVDYYAQASAPEDDARASNRMARVEYKRDAPVKSIAAGDGEALAEWVYADASLYREKDADGVVPDPNEAARAAGLDANKQWAWKLTGTQSRRSGLTESCDAYLAEANDLSAGRIDSASTTALYRACDIDFSRWDVQDTSFDPIRYHGLTKIHYLPDVDSTQYDDRYNVGMTQDTWFTLSSAVEESFYGAFKVRAVDGAELKQGDYTATFQRFDPDTLSYVDAQLGEADGPLLMTVTPNAGTGYTGELKEWVLVRGHAGSVRECYVDGVADAWRAPVYNNGLNTTKAVSFSGMPYAVGISVADTSSALLAAGYAGLVGAPLCVRDTENESYGFSIATGFVSDGRITGNETVYGTGRFDTMGTFSAAAFKVFERNRSSIGATTADYPWGDTAVVLNPKYVNDVAAGAAAYAYAKKAPVFYSGDDGSVGDDVLACLKGFSNVVVIGGDGCFSARAYDALDAALGDDAALARVSAEEQSAGALSLTVAQLLVEDGLASCGTVAISDVADPIDAICALNLAGSQGGVSLASSSIAESKAICAYLQANRDEVNTVRLFGRNGTNMTGGSFDLRGMLGNLWSSSYEAPEVGAGDTAMVGGVRFTIGDDGGTLVDPVELWAHSAIAAGSYSVAGVELILRDAVVPSSGYEEVAIAPTAAAGLVYSGKEQVGVAEGAGYTLSGTASATDAGGYSATATLEEGYAWESGSTEPVTLEWSIAKAKAAVPKAKTGLVYNGEEQAGVPAGAGFTLKGNTATNGGDYTATATLDGNHVWADGTDAAKAIPWKIGPAGQAVSAKAKTAKLKASKLRKKAQSVKAAKVAKGNGASTKLAYRLVKVDKKKSKKYFKVAGDGKITVKKGLRKGTYKVTVRATAEATANYKSAYKDFVVTVKVK